MRLFNHRFAAIAVALLSFSLRAHTQGSNATAYDTNPSPDLSWVPQSILSLRLTANISLSSTAHLFWTISESDATATFAIANRQPPTWLGFGLSETGSMKGADIALLRKNASGGLYLTDMHASDFVEPAADMSQDLELITATQTDSVTAFAFKRKIDAQCLDEDLSVRLTTNQWVITAFGSSEAFAYHGPNNRAARELWLLDPMRNFIQFVAPADAQTLVLRSSSKPYQIPMEDTVYCYSFHTLPNDTTYHVVMEEAITSPATHHIVAYRCNAQAAAYAMQLYSGAGNETQCAHFSANPADYKRVFNPCGDVWAEWALGQGPLIMPNDVGKPFGNDSFYSPVHIMLEMHYDNTRRLNVTDESGLKLTYTKTLRKFDMGTLTLGTNFPLIKIPKGLAAFPVPSVCPQECTSQIPTPLNVIGNFFHMHKWGKDMSAKIVRNGREIIEFRNKYWDNGFQSIQKVSNFSILPGDTIQTVCNYDTTKSNETIVGGWATYNEMCYLFLSYYPAVSFPNCLPLTGDGTTECSYAGKSKTGSNQLPPGFAALPSETNAPGAMCPAALNVTASPPPVSSPSPSTSPNSTTGTGKPGSSVWWKPSCAPQVWALAAVAGAAVIMW